MLASILIFNITLGKEGGCIVHLLCTQSIFMFYFSMDDKVNKYSHNLSYMQEFKSYLQDTPL